jgi:hypothetical protein
LETPEAPWPNRAAVDAADMSSGADPPVTLTRIWKGEIEEGDGEKRGSQRGEEIFLFFLGDLRGKTVRV